MLVELERTDYWESMIESIDKDQIPINCVKKVIFKLKGGKQKTINLERLRKEGLDIEELETVVTSKMINLSTKIVNMNFVIDTDAVKQIIQPITDEILK
jgi:Leucine-rich repeat (LRR) protein